jgi:hypothetical protein
VAGAAVALVLLVVGCSGADEPVAQPSSTTTAGEAASGDGSVTSTAPVDEGSTTSTADEPRDLPTLDLADDEQAYVDALMTQPAEGLEPDQAACIAGHWIQIVGVDAVEAAGITPEGIRDGSQSINDIPVDRATAEQVVDSYEACDFDIVALVVDGFSQTAEGDPEQAACIERVVTPEVAREYFVLAIMGSASGEGSAAGEGSPELVEIQRLIQPCLEAG